VTYAFGKMSNATANTKKKNQFSYEKGKVKTPRKKENRKGRNKSPKERGKGTAKEERTDDQLQKKRES